MSSVIEAIKAKIDLVDEVGLVVALQKSGKSFKGLCPFHNERTPSFYVFAETQTWRCFGCHEGGDIFTFVEKQQSLEFREALLYLAEKAGVAVDDYGDRDPEVERETHAQKERLRKLNEEALLWFHQMLLRSREAVEARVYLQQRGITSDSVIAFSLGYAPEHGDGLSRYLLGRGYTERELISGGLAREREGAQSGIYDYFRGRLIFPIRDMRSRVIGFGGRILGEGQPKYLNSPQTLLFEKNSVLYAMDMAKDAIKQAQQVIIVEGYVDALIAHQYGTKQTVACIGSAITEKHIQQLKKLTKQVTLALDPDAAGAAATEHGIQEALKAFDRTIVPVPLVAEQRTSRAEQSGQRMARGAGRANERRGRHEPRGMIRLEEQVDAVINVLQLPAGEDPDEFIRRDLDGWHKAVAQPLPLIDYYFVVRSAGLNLREPSGKAEVARRLLPVVSMISDRVKRDAYLRKLASMISIDERSLNEELQRILRGQKPAGVIADFSERPGQRGQRTPGEAKQAEREETGRGEKGEVPDQKQGRDRRTSGLDRGSSNRIEWEDYLIGLLLRNPGLSIHVCGIINDGDFAGTDTRELYRIFNTVYQRGSSPLHQPFEDAVPSALLETVERARKSIETGSLLEGTGLTRAAVQCATRLKRARLLQENTELQYLLREAREGGDVVGEQRYRQQLLGIHQQIRTIDSAMHLQG